MHLLERQEQLDALNRTFQDARNSSGGLVLVSGEAGIGKSSLVERFVAEHRREARIVWGGCDALATPRALAPVHEIAAQMSIQTGRAQHHEEREGLFRSIIADLTEPQRVWILVLEDTHWADESTLDFLRYVGKRIQRTCAVLVATYRDEELARSHPVRLALGELMGHHILRLRLAPLSLEAVRVLANDSGRDPAVIHETTGGNPFFLRELLASTGVLVPETVRDAVLARLMRCSPAARDLAELVCISPGRTEAWLIESVLGVQHAAIDEAGARGLVHVQSDGVEFRHDIARRAVYSGIPAERARLLHKRILDALIERGTDLTRLIHHAILAGDVGRILEYAPLAAAEAASLGAHRAAAAHLAAALNHSESLPLRLRAELCEQHAHEASLANQAADSIRSATVAASLWHEAGNIAAQARVLCLLSQEYRTVGDKERADHCVSTAITLFESTAPRSAELGRAYSARALLAANRGWDREALDFGRRALAIAREVGSHELEADALSTIGQALLGQNDLSGYAALEESLQIARAHKLDDQEASAYRRLLFYSVLIHDFARAEPLFTEGLSLCEERGIFSHSAYIQAYFAPCELDRGRWAEAAEMAGRLLDSAHINGVQQRITLLATLAIVRVRRGDPGAEELLEQAFHLALPTGEINRIGRVAAARAEHAWYREDYDQAWKEAETGLSYIGNHNAPWIKGELLYWRSRVGTAAEMPTDIAAPYRLMIEGLWQEAAEAWQRIGMPYEQALALLEGPEHALREALGICEKLNAARLAAIIRRRLREQGAKGIPRGPNESTRMNSAGLTAREIEVLSLVARGSTNAQIGRRLHRSTKTIDHHLSAILEKLQVRSRAEAVATAFALNILRAPSDTQRPPETDTGLAKSS